MVFSRFDVHDLRSFFMNKLGTRARASYLLTFFTFIFKIKTTGYASGITNIEIG